MVNGGTEAVDNEQMGVVNAFHLVYKEKWDKPKSYPTCLGGYFLTSLWWVVLLAVWTLTMYVPWGSEEMSKVAAL